MKKTSVKTIGILTSGGDAPGLNAAIRGVCRSAMINYGMKIVGIRNGYRGLVNGDCFKIDGKCKSGDFSIKLSSSGFVSELSLNNSDTVFIFKNQIRH